MSRAARHAPVDTLHLWWLQDPAAPRLVGTLRHVRRAGPQPGGVSLAYAEAWLASATRHEGSWWEDWARWIAPYGGKRVRARVPAAGGEDAPGSYVKQRIA